MAAAPRKAYPSDLTDEQWEYMQIVLPDAKPGGRPRATDLREVVNALLDQNRSGCQWDMLPHDLPPKSTVYDYFAACATYFISSEKRNFGANVRMD